MTNMRRRRVEREVRGKKVRTSMPRPASKCRSVARISLPGRAPLAAVRSSATAEEALSSVVGGRGRWEVDRGGGQGCMGRQPRAGSAGRIRGLDCPGLLSWRKEVRRNVGGTHGCDGIGLWDAVDLSFECRTGSVRLRKISIGFAACCCAMSAFQIHGDEGEHGGEQAKWMEARMGDVCHLQARWHSMRAMNIHR